jgi:HEAT repeat protein
MNFKRLTVVTALLCLTLTGSAWGFDLQTAIKGLDDDSARVRRDAAYYLGEHGGADCVPGLIAALSDPDGHVRRIAARALGKIRDPRAVDPLAALVVDRTQPVCVRAAAADALGNLGRGATVPVLRTTAAGERGWLKRSAEGALSQSARLTLNRMDRLRFPGE